MSNTDLTTERNIFLGGFFALAGVGIVFRLVGLSLPEGPSEGLWTLAAILTLMAKGIFVYLVFRLSSFLENPGWLTGLYCVLTLFSVLYLIPLIGLLIGVRKARERAYGTDARAPGPASPGGTS